VSQRFDKQQMIETFRANHRDPRNIALHVAGYVLVLRGLKRLFTGHFFSSFLQVGAGLGLLVGGHQIEGSDPFSIFKQGGAPQEATFGNGQLAAKT
jgi:hypothetical protein